MAYRPHGNPDELPRCAQGDLPPPPALFLCFGPPQGQAASLTDCAPPGSRSRSRDMGHLRHSTLVNLSPPDQQIHTADSLPTHPRDTELTRATARPKATATPCRPRPMPPASDLPRCRTALHPPRDPRRVPHHPATTETRHCCRCSAQSIRTVGAPLYPFLQVTSSVVRDVCIYIYIYIYIHLCLCYIWIYIYKAVRVSSILTTGGDKYDRHRPALRKRIVRRARQWRLDGF